MASERLLRASYRERSGSGLGAVEKRPEGRRGRASCGLCPEPWACRRAAFSASPGRRRDPKAARLLPALFPPPGAFRRPALPVALRRSHGRIVSDAPRAVVRGSSGSGSPCVARCVGYFV